MKKRFFAFFFLIIVFNFSCTKKSLPAQTHIVLGTICSVNLFDNGTKKIYNSLFEQLNSIEQKMSINIEDSEISKINRAAGIEAVFVSEETFYVIEQALFFAQESNGIFDPTVGPLVTLWGIGSDNAHLPSKEQIDTVLTKINYKNVEINSEKKSVFLKEKGMKLDVGGIAKGYAADVLAALIQKAGIKHALVDLGGNIYAVGTRQDGQAWRVGVKNPYDPDSSPVLRVDVINKSVVTSGLYERFFIQDGIRFHHILDVKTGYPAKTDVLSFTIVADSSLVADALSTTCFILGEEKGLAFIENFRKNKAVKIEAVSISDGSKISFTKGLEVKILNTDFSF